MSKKRKPFNFTDGENYPILEALKRKGLKKFNLDPQINNKELEVDFSIKNNSFAVVIKREDAK